MAQSLTPAQEAELVNRMTVEERQAIVCQHLRNDAHLCYDDIDYLVFGPAHANGWQSFNLIKKYHLPVTKARFLKRYSKV